MKKIVSVLVSIALIMSLVSSLSCAFADELNIDYNAVEEYTIWGLTNEEGVNAGFQAGVAKAKEKFPNVTLIIEPDPQDGDVKIKTAAAAGTMPDFYITNNSLVQTFKRSDNNVALDKYLEETGLMSELDQEVMKDFIDPFDGHIYGFAFELPGSVDMVANMDLLNSIGIEKLPTNFDEFKTYIEVCNEHGVIPAADSFKEGFICAQFFDMILSREGYSLWDLDQGIIKATDDVFIKAATKAKELVDLGMFSPAAFTISGEDARLSFLNNEAGMCRMAGTTWADYFDKRADGRNFELVGYPFQDAGQEYDNTVRAGGGVRNTGYAVSPYAKDLDVAAAWLCYFSIGCVEGLYKQGYATQKLTTNDISIEKEFGKLSQELFDIDVKSITPMPWAWNHADSYGVICDQCNKLFTGDYSVEDFVNDTDEMMQEILEDD